MNDLPKEGLRALVAQEGVALLGDPERVRTLLRERFPQFPEEVEALARVLEEGVLESLTQSPEVSRDLETRTGLSREHILWGVQGWMDALPPEAVPGPSAPELRASVSGDLPVSPAAQAPQTSPEVYASWEDLFRSEPLPREFSLEERNLALLGLSGDRGRLFTSPLTAAPSAPPPPLPQGLDAFFQSPSREIPNLPAEPELPVPPVFGKRLPEEIAPEAAPLLPKVTAPEPGWTDRLVSEAVPPKEFVPEPERVAPPLPEGLFPKERTSEVAPLFAAAPDAAAEGSGGVPEEDGVLSQSAARDHSRREIPEISENAEEEISSDRPMVRRTLATFPPPLPQREFTPAFSEPEAPTVPGEAPWTAEDRVTEFSSVPDDMEAVDQVLREQPSRHRLSLLGRRLAFLFVLAALAGGGAWAWWHRPGRFFDQGQDLFQRKEFAQAAALFQRGLEGDAKNTDALFLLGESFRALGSADEALGAYEEVLQLTSGDAMLFVGMGEAHLARGEASHAVRAFDQALALVPNFTEARKGLGLAYLALGNYLGARDALEQALKGRRDDLPLMKTLAAVRRMLEDPGGARVLYEEVLALTPEDQEAREGLAASLREEEERKKAQEELRAREAIQGLLDRGFSLLSEGKPQDALGAFLQVRSLDPRAADALEGLLEAHLALGQKDRAEAVYREALEGASGDLGLRDAVEQARAEALFRHEQLLLFQGTPLLRGEELLREGSPAAALPLFREALSADIRELRGWKGLGKALLAVGSPDEALGAFRQGAKLVSGDEELSRGLREAREMRELQERRKKAADLVRRGEEQERQGRQRRASTLYRQALTLVSNDQNALRGMARMAAVQGLHGDAATYYRRLLRVNSGDVASRQELARLERLEGARLTPPPLSPDARGKDRPRDVPRTTAGPAPEPTLRPLPMTGPVTPARERLGAIHARRGRTLAAREAYTGAAREYRRALELSPWQGAYRNNLGWSFARMGVNEAALAEFRQVVLQDGGQAEVQNNYGWALARGGDPLGAARAFAVCLRLSDDWAGDEYLVLRAPLGFSRDIEAAASEDALPFVRAAQAAAAVRPEEESFYWNMALVTYEAGRRSPQFAVSSDALARLLLGHAWMRKDPSRARETLAQGDGTDGWMASTRMTLVGHAAAREGRGDVAAEAYRRALELDARNDEARWAWQALERP